MAPAPAPAQARSDDRGNPPRRNLRWSPRRSRSCRSASAACRLTGILAETAHMSAIVRLLRQDQAIARPEFVEARGRQDRSPPAPPRRLVEMLEPRRTLRPSVKASRGAEAFGEIGEDGVIVPRLAEAVRDAVASAPATDRWRCRRYPRAPASWCGQNEIGVPRRRGPAELMHDQRIQLARTRGAGG